MVELDSSMKSSDWSSTNDICVMFQLLRQSEKLDRALWRSFQCTCCRCVWEYIADFQCRSGIEKAERYIGGLADTEESRQAFVVVQTVEDHAWEVVRSLRVTGESNEWIWPVSAEVDGAWVRYSSACAAKTCLLV